MQRGTKQEKERLHENVETKEKFESITNKQQNEKWAYCTIQ